MKVITFDDLVEKLREKIDTFGILRTCEHPNFKIVHGEDFYTCCDCGKNLTKPASESLSEEIERFLGLYKFHDLAKPIMEMVEKHYITLLQAEYKRGKESREIEIHKLKLSGIGFENGEKRAIVKFNNIIKIVRDELEIHESAGTKICAKAVYQLLNMRMEELFGTQEER